jgi:hypothetical protein
MKRFIKRQVPILGRTTEAFVGKWTDPRDIEAIAHCVLILATQIHNSGMDLHGSAHRRPTTFLSSSYKEADFTFTQRVHFSAALMMHSKAAGIRP